MVHPYRVVLSFDKRAVQLGSDHTYSIVFRTRKTIHMPAHVEEVSSVARLNSHSGHRVLSNMGFCCSKSKTPYNLDVRVPTHTIPPFSALEKLEMLTLLPSITFMRLRRDVQAR